MDRLASALGGMTRPKIIFSDHVDPLLVIGQHPNTGDRLLTHILADASRISDSRAGLSCDL